MKFLEYIFVFNFNSFLNKIALLSNSKRTSDVVAIDYCVVEVFTKEDYRKLQKSFPGNDFSPNRDIYSFEIKKDIASRLRMGIKLYKRNNIGKLLEIAKNSFLFKGSDDEQV